MCTVPRVWILRQRMSTGALEEWTQGGLQSCKGIETGHSRLVDRASVARTGTLSTRRPISKRYQAHDSARHGRITQISERRTLGLITASSFVAICRARCSKLLSSDAPESSTLPYTVIIPIPFKSEINLPPSATLPRTAVT
jgi:hypothetical protein